jgi:hypothetical protein
MSTKTFEKQSGTVEVFDGMDIKVSRSTNKGTTYWTQFAAELEIPCVFKLTREKWYDRLFKFFGIAVEIQSGDVMFDRLIYIACDHPEFSREIQLDARSRKLITGLLTEDCRFISCDGHTLFIRYDGKKVQTSELLKQIADLKTQFSDVGSHTHNLLSDPFVKRAFIIEALIWSFAGYAIVGLGEWLWNKQDVHIDSSQLMWTGVKLGGLLGAGLFTIVLLLLSGSSRSHRLLVESVLVISLSLPFGGIHLVSDLNRNLDRSPTVTINAEVSQVVERVHIGRRGSKSYSYHMYVVRTDLNEFRLPSEIEVNYRVYQVTRANSKVPVVVGQGWLKQPWIKSVNGVEY